jgi:hypothetical protein
MGHKKKGTGFFYKIWEGFSLFFMGLWSLALLVVHFREFIEFFSNPIRYLFSLDKDGEKSGVFKRSSNRRAQIRAEIRELKRHAESSETDVLPSLSSYHYYESEEDRGLFERTYRKFTGKDKFEEAEARYEALKKRFVKQLEKYERETDELIDELNVHVEAINGYKVQIKTELFPSYADKMSLIKGVNISKKFPLEEFMQGETDFHDVRDREDLFSIDFTEHPIVAHLKCWFTMGIWSRKLAKETLYKVQEEEKRVEEEFARMEAEIEKLRLIKISLMQIEGYYKDLIILYQQMLTRLDNSVNFLYTQNIKLAGAIGRRKLDGRTLPIVQQTEIKCINKASIIMKKMVDTCVTVDASTTSIEEYKRKMGRGTKEIQEYYLAA